MYAVIETGGKQYRVEVGTELAVERLDAEPGETITLDRVLLVADGDATAIGHPLVAEAVVSAEVVRQDLADKVIVFKYRPKARHRSKRGHRQQQTILRVTDVTFGGRSAAKETERQAELKKTERERLEEGARRQAEADAALAAKLAATEAAEKAPAEETGKAAKPARRTRAKTAEAKPADTTAEAEPTEEPTEEPAPTTKGTAAKASSASKSKTKGSKASADQPATKQAAADKATTDKPARRTRSKQTENKDE